MKAIVNPFEPWRPVEDQAPPPLHVGRPWRPSPPPPVLVAVEEPLDVEPVHPSARNKKSVPPKRPQRPAAKPSAVRTPIRHLTALVVLSVVSVLFLVSLDWINSTHLPRLMALGASLGMFVGMVFNRRRSWYSRLTWMTASLALAGNALWFVPTVHGVSLWSAYRKVEDLRALPAGDVSAFQHGAAARRTLVEDFPSFSADVSAAEQAWLRRTVDEAVTNADRQSRNDPHAALVQLHKLDEDLKRLDHYPSVRKDLESARRSALQACLKVAHQP